MQRYWSIVLVSLVSAFASQASGTPIDSTITINGGVVQGNPRSNTGVLEFLGIPFAAPSVGDLRWKPPQPAPKACNGINATAFGASCYASEAGGPVFGPQSEDCLTINIWSASQDTEEKRPVMVWVYGGGFQFGTSAQPNYNGANLALEEVVVVTFNYRLGVFGFLALQELDAESPNSGNFGLQDQLAALQWIQDNISKFGGDPDNVTIFGESAGAHAIGLLLTSKLSTGLFHKCILESGAYWDGEHGSIPTFNEARDRGRRFQQKLGATSVAELRALSATTVNDAALWNSSTDPSITAFAPSIDNFVIHAAPGTVFDKGQTQKVPILAGFNANEQFLFLPRALPHQTPLQYFVSMETFFAGRADEALELYPGDTEEQATQSANELVGDLIIREQTFEALHQQAKTSGQACYGYYFTYTSSYSPQAIHTAEIDFVFGNLGPNPLFGQTPPPSAEDVQMSKTLMTYWTNFAKTGNPNSPDGGSGLPNWPSYDPDNGRYLELGHSVHQIDVPHEDRLKFIKSLRTNGVLPIRWGYEFVDN